MRTLLMVLASLIWALPSFADGGPRPDGNWYEPTALPTAEPAPSADSYQPADPAPSYRNYFAGTAGVFFPDDYTTSQTFHGGELTVTGTADFDSGWDASFTYGRQITDWFSLEAEVAHAAGFGADDPTVDFDYGEGGSQVVFEDCKANADFTRAYINARFSVPGRVSPYVLAGAGGGLVTADLYCPGEEQKDRFVGDAQDYAGVWQVGGGVLFNISERTAIDMTGRYTETIGLDLGPLANSSEFGGWVLRGGLHHRF